MRLISFLCGKLIYSITVVVILATFSVSKTSVLQASSRAKSGSCIPWPTTYPDRSTLVSRSLVGVSWEKGAHGFGAGVFNPKDSGLIALLRMLGPSSTIRLGGNSSDTSPPAEFSQKSIDNLAEFMRELGPDWQLIYGLNGKAGTEAIKVEEVAEVERVEQGFADRRVVFQIGNEPDLYGSPNDLSSFLSMWKTRFDAIRLINPRALFVGPDIASPMTKGQGWLDTFKARFEGQISGLSAHYYYTGVNRSLSPAELLQRENHDLDSLARAGRAAAEAVPIFLTETNSINLGGIEGISDQYVSGTWSALAGIILAQNGWGGMDVHGGGDPVGPGNWYTPYEKVGQKWLPTAVFGGMVLAAKLSGGWIEGSVVSDAARGISVRKGNEHRFLLVNEQLADSLQICAASRQATLTEIYRAGASPDKLTEIDAALLRDARGEPVLSRAVTSGISAVTVPPLTVVLVVSHDLD